MASDKEAALARIVFSPVRAGQTWRHVKSGGKYIVVAVALEEATLTPVVVYRGHDDVVWTRPLDEFLRGENGRWRFVNDDDPCSLTAAVAYLSRYA